MNKKELAFEYFKKNPNALREKESAKHYKALGIKAHAYFTYKREYKSIAQATECKELRIRNPEKYFKGRLRQKFCFDDSNLFKKVEE